MKLKKEKTKITTEEKIHGFIETAKKQNLKLTEIYVTPEEYDDLLRLAYTHMVFDRPSPPINSRTKHTRAYRTFLKYEKAECERVQYDYSVPEYLEALKKYNEKEKTPAQMVFFGVKIKIKQLNKESAK